MPARTRLIKLGTASLVILAFFGMWLAMTWTGRQPDSIVLLGAVAIVLGAGYYLWDDAMGEGVAAVEDLQDSGDDNDQN